jgi:hypothetical protein
VRVAAWIALGSSTPPALAEYFKNLRRSIGICSVLTGERGKSKVGANDAILKPHGRTLFPEVVK